ncbi:hypothetical protein ACS0TY_032068 [Phlomoides rotata]
MRALQGKQRNCKPRSLRMLLLLWNLDGNVQMVGRIHGWSIQPDNKSDAIH